MYGIRTPPMALPLASRTISWFASIAMPLACGGLIPWRAHSWRL